MIDLRSDTVTLPSTEMKQFLFDSPLGDDVYGEDPSVNLLEKKVSDLFGKEDALFVPSGTMANLISVLAHCNRGDEVILGDKSHIFLYEAGGISAFGGIHSYQLKNHDNGTINITDIQNSIRRDDPHYPISKLLCLENTHNACYGSPIDAKYFIEVKHIINKHNIKLHIDGARIFNASIALNTPLDELTKEADSISCCLSKGLSCPVGSLIVGSKDFIHKAHRLRKSLGGGMRQAGLLAAAGIYALDNIFPQLNIDHENAKMLAEGLSTIKELSMDASKVKTNLIFFYLENSNLSDEQFINKLLEYNIKLDAKGNRKFRIATHTNFKKNDIDFVVETIQSIVKQ